MTLNERDKKLFETLSGSETGKSLIDYLERVKVELFDPEELTEENVISRKEAWKFIQDYLLARLGSYPKTKKVEPNQYT